MNKLTKTLKTLAQQTNHETTMEFSIRGSDKTCFAIYTDSVVESTAAIVGLAYERDLAFLRAGRHTQTLEDGHPIKRAFQDAHVDALGKESVIYFPRLTD